MSWTMNVNPLGNLALSALVAFVPILFLFTALTVLKMKGHWAAIIATSLAVGVACIAFGMPMQYAGLSVVYGALFGLFSSLLDRNHCPFHLQHVREDRTV